MEVAQHALGRVSQAVMGMGGYRHAYSVRPSSSSDRMSVTHICFGRLAAGTRRYSSPRPRVMRPSGAQPDGASSTAASRAFLESSRVPVLSAAASAASCGAVPFRAGTLRLQATYTSNSR